MKRGKWTWIGLALLLVIGWGSLASEALAQDIGWMQKGVRVWYFGGIDVTEIQDTPVSNTEETYLINGFDGDQVSVTHHSAAEYWSSPRPVETETYPWLDKGPCWIHPQVLQNLKSGDIWMGQEIALVERKTYTIYTNDSNDFPYHLLPALALFKLTPQRLLVKISYMIPNFSSTGVAYFDAETGILLYYNALWDFNGKVYKMFFILSEINYDFGARKAFPEDGGPHTGFKSFLSEQSITGGGSAVIQSMVETRYGNTVEMLVLTSLLGSGLINKSENYCFFGDVPIVRYKDHTLASNFPPEQWDQYGKYLWWWLPPGALAGTSINVLGVPMTWIPLGLNEKSIRSLTTDSGMPSGARFGLSLAAPGTHYFSATQTQQAFFYSGLWFGDDGYMTLFSAKDPPLGLNIQADQIFKNNNTVNGLDYYRTVMGTATPSKPSAFNKVSPANGAAIPAVNPTLSWGNSPGAASYEYCYDKSNNTTCDGNWTTAGFDNSVILSGLDKGNTYYWQVRALNDLGTIDADEGNWWGFTTSLYYYLYLPMTLK